MLYDLNLEKFFSSYDEGEKIYKNYIQTDDVSSIDASYIEEHHMFIPGISGALEMLDESMFGETDTLAICLSFITVIRFLKYYTYFPANVRTM